MTESKAIIETTYREFKNVKNHSKTSTGYMNVIRLFSDKISVRFSQSQEKTVNAGDIIILNAFDEVLFLSEGLCKYQMFTFDSPRFFVEIGIPSMTMFQNYIKKDDRIIRLCDMIEYEYNYHSAFHEKMLSSLICELLIHLTRFYSINSETTSGVMLGKHKIVRKAVSYICDNCQTGLTTSDISAKVNVSTSYLCRCFKEILATTPLDYSETIRFRKIKEDLTLGIYSVSEVAEMYNFSSLSYFNRRYRKYYGVNPSVTLADAKKRHTDK